MHSKGVHIPQPIHSKLSRLCPESVQPDSPAGALAGRADQPRYRSERDPAARPDATRPRKADATRPRKGQRGPNAGNRGAPGRREGAPRNRGPRDRQRGRRARETPGNVWDANSVLRHKRLSGDGATSGGPTIKPERTTKQAGRTQTSPRRQRSRGRRGRPAGGNTRMGWAHTSCGTGEARRRLPGAISCRACPGTGRRAGRHRAGPHGRDCYTSQ